MYASIIYNFDHFDISTVLPNTRASTEAHAATGIPRSTRPEENIVQLEKAFEYINRFPWLELFFHECIATKGNTDKGWMTKMLRKETRHIAVQPIKKLNLDRNPACCYFYPVPDGEVGVEKEVDTIAFVLTAPGISFRLSRPSGTQTVTEANFSARSQISYSVSATLCYQFASQPRDEYNFEYLASTHSIRSAVTELCERYGHTYAVRLGEKKCFFDTIRAEAIVVTRLISFREFGDIFRTFDIYDLRSQLGITDLCRKEHRK